MRDSIFQRLMSTEEGKRAYCREDLLLQVAQRICKIMQDKRITRKKLAEITGVTKGHISQLLNGNHNMTLVTISDLFYALGCKVTVEVSPCTVEDFADAIMFPQDKWEAVTLSVSAAMPPLEPQEPEATYKYKMAG